MSAPPPSPSPSPSPSPAIASSYAQLLERARVPEPALQRHAVSALYKALSSSADPNSPEAHDVIVRTLVAPSVAAADEASRGLCRLVASGAVPVPAALVDLLAALESNSSSASILKAIGFVTRIGFGNGTLSAEQHPLVRTLDVSRPGVEVVRLISLFVRECGRVGGVKVAKFLKPVIMFAAVKGGYGGFWRDLVEVLAAAVAAGFPAEAVPVLEMLVEGLRFFPRRNTEEVRMWTIAARCLVDAYVVTLRKLAHDGMSTAGTQHSSIYLLVALLHVSPVNLKLLEGTDVHFDFSKHLMEVQKELLLQYLPEFSVLYPLISFHLIRFELENEQLAVLNYLSFLIDWKSENALTRGEAMEFLPEELICIFPVIKLVMSPSNKIKATACHVLSCFGGLNFTLPVSASKEQLYIGALSSFNTISAILSRLIYYLWFEPEPSSRSFSYVELLFAEFGHGFVEKKYERKHWTTLLKEYLPFSHKHKSSEYTENLLSETSAFLSSVAFILVKHAMYGLSAVHLLTTLGTLDNKLALQVLTAILFYCKLLCNSEKSSDTLLLLKLLESLPTIASHSFMLPIVHQTIIPLRHRETTPELYCIAVRLLCKLWITSDWAFPSLQGVINSKNFLDFNSRKDLSTSLAASVRDVCKHNPDRGVDLIVSVSSSIESNEPVVKALGAQSLGYLCEADVVDFYTAWSVTSKHLLDYTVDPIVACCLCTLLKWGKLDAEIHSDAARNIINILWAIAASKDNNLEPLWVKARSASFKSLSMYKISLLEDAISDFKRRNFDCLTNENNPDILEAMEDLEIEIMLFEHTTRRRGIKGQRVLARKFEKYLNVLPRSVFSPGRSLPHDLPGAALLSFDFCPKDMIQKGIHRDITKINAAYSQAFGEMSESLIVSRNMIVALIAWQSWEPFVRRWTEAVFACDENAPDQLERNINVASYILKLICKFPGESIPRAAVNSAFAIGALCLVVPSAAHRVVSSSADFLLKWLFSYEHEHLQWSAAITLGAISGCFHPTDKKQKFGVITALLEALNRSENYFVKGACCVGLGFASLSLFETGVTADSNREEILATTEEGLLASIICTLSEIIGHLCPFACEEVKKLNECLSCESIGSGYVALNQGRKEVLEEDFWFIAGSVLGLGNSVIALYRMGAYAAVTEIKKMMISWLLDLDLSVDGSVCLDENQIPLCIGSCLALPSVIAFCQRVELLDDDIDEVLNHYILLASVLINSNLCDTLYQNLLMAVCIGAGSFLSCVLSVGIHSFHFDDVKRLFNIFDHISKNTYPSSVHMGGMFGIVNAFGSSTGVVDHRFPYSSKSPMGTDQESSLVGSPILYSPVCATLCESVILEIFSVARDSKDKGMQNIAAWALSFLRKQQLATDADKKELESGSHYTENSSQGFSENSLVWNLSLWLKDLYFEKTSGVEKTSTVQTVLRCLSKAPRLPTFDWGAIIRRCMGHELQASDLLIGCQKLRNECIVFSLSHASQISPLLHLLDDLTQISRFRTLDFQLQSLILQHLYTLVKLFSESRLVKLGEDIIEFLGFSSLYFTHATPQQSSLRLALWKGLHGCLTHGSDHSGVILLAEKIMGFLLSFLPVNCVGQAGCQEEWSEAVKCLTFSREVWRNTTLEVESSNLNAGKHGATDDMGRIIVIKARLVRSGFIPTVELGRLKMLILSARTEGMWWTILVEVAAATYTLEMNVKRQWLLDALDISCVSEYPSTALRFVGLLSGVCCCYMPLLIANPTYVLSDLPVTIPSLLSTSGWASARSTIIEKLWLSMTRMYDWAKELIHGGDPGCCGIHQNEAEVSILLARSMQSTCIALKDFLPFEKQIKLANLELL